MIKNAHSRFI